MTTQTLRTADPYDTPVAGFDWTIAEAELGYRHGEPLNIGWYCSDRICRLGLARKRALIWEDFAGNARTYTFDDLRVLSNTVARFLTALGIAPGERVCLFMDRVPELYLGFLGILKMGGVAQPLFSAFGEESLWTRLDDAGTAAILTQRKHLGKVRRIRARLPALRHVIVVDADGTPLHDRERALALDSEPPGGRVRGLSLRPRDAFGAPLHLRHDGIPEGRAARPLLAHLAVPHGEVGARPAAGRHLLVQRGSGLGDRHVVRDHRPLVERHDPGRARRGVQRAWLVRFIERHRVTVWYSAPTAIRLLMREGTRARAQFDLSSLRHLCSVGEPLNAEAVLWSREAYGPPFHDTFWQTETGCIVITNFPGMPIKPGSMGKPFPGITAAVLDPRTFEPVTETGRVGLIALRPGWPSMMRGYWNNPTGMRRSSGTAGISAATAPASIPTATSGSSAATTT